MKKLVFAGLTIFLLSSCGNSGRTPQRTVPASVDRVGSDASTATVAPPKGLVPDHFREYIGREYPPLPEGLSQRYGLAIWGSNDYSLAKISDGENDMLWLEKMIRRDPNGMPIWEVKDILVLPKLEGATVFVPDQCLFNGEPNPEILAIGKMDDEVFSTRHLTNEKIFLRGEQTLM